MRIQHNIMAMNAYRNYTNNVSAMKKNLEQLSSGYKINRAGDDAAGLAISEKMRAQITGLNAAQKNVKDGISLVKTAEGAMQEIQDMLNRMDYLATQSANGTYQDEVDREALQKEVNQLKDEINRIADSANFNGIKLLDGSLDSTSSETINATTFAGEKTGLYVPKNGNNDLINDVAGTAQGWGLYTHKDATGAAKTSFEARMSNYEAKGLEAGQEVTVSFQLRPHTDPDDPVSTDNTFSVTVKADENGELTGEMVAKAVADYFQDNGGTGGAGTVDLTNKSGVAVNYNVTAKGDSLVFEMSDKGYQQAKAEYDPNAGALKNMVFNGNYNIVMKTTVTREPEVYAANDGDADATNSTAKAVASGKYFKADGSATAAGDLTDGAKVYDKDGNELTVAVDGTSHAVTITGPITVGDGWTDNSTSVTKQGNASAITQLADGLVAPGNSGWAAGDFKDGAGIRLGDTNYVFALTDDTMKAKFDANTKVVDLRQFADKDGNLGGAYIDDALHRVVDAAGDNKMWSVQLSNNGNMIAIREREDYNGNGEGGRADLTTREGIEKQVQMFTKATGSSTVKEAKGKALQLQIGDTSDEFNRLNVSVGDMHTSALGIADLDIGTAEKAAAAIQTVKDAINNVSGVRGDLGAYQNRLEHTANNLSVMAENIQDAESTIRDTDIAEEMMAYTKNNILVQSAQAMLAQANQVPQGVLQLLG